MVERSVGNDGKECDMRYATIVCLIYICIVLGGCSFLWIQLNIFFEKYLAFIRGTGLLSSQLIFDWNCW